MAQTRCRYAPGPAVVKKGKIRNPDSKQFLVPISKSHDHGIANFHIEKSSATERGTNKRKLLFQRVCPIGRSSRENPAVVTAAGFSSQRFPSSRPVLPDEL
jgi:hypothetical protein